MTDKETIVGECAAAYPETKQETTGAPVSSTITTGDPHSSPHTVNHDDVPPSPGSSPRHHHRHHSHSHRHRHNSRERLSTDPSDDVKDEDKDRDRHRSRSRHHHHHHRHHSHRSKSRKERSTSRSRSPARAVALPQQQEQEQPPRKRRSGWDQPGAAGGVAVSPAAMATAMREDSQRRSVYVGGVPPETTELEVRNLFSAFGPVVRVELARDTSTGKVKGYGFVDFATDEAAAAVLAIKSPLLIAGRELKLGRPHQTQPPSSTPGITGSSVTTVTSSNSSSTSMSPAAESALAATTAAALACGTAEQLGEHRRSCRIFVGNVAFEVGELQLREIFAPFGTVVSCTLVSNPETGRHRGYGFLEFDSPRSAEAAIVRMNNFPLLGRALRVGPAAPLSAPLPPVLAPGTAAVLPLAPPRETSLSSEENLTITPAQRFLLMQSLARDTPLGQQQQQQQQQQQKQPVGATGAAGIIVAVPPVVVLENLLPPGVPADADLPGEVRDECSRYGAVAAVVPHADDASGAVAVFVRFGALAAAETAVQRLNGRYFGGRVIAASLVSDLALIARVGV